MRMEVPVHKCIQFWIQDFHLGGIIFGQVKKLNNKITYLKSYSKEFHCRIRVVTLGSAPSALDLVALKPMHAFSGDLLATLLNDIYKQSCIR